MPHRYKSKSQSKSSSSILNPKASAFQKHPKKNPKVIIYSVIALLFIYFMYSIHWAFIIPAALLSYLSWRELFKKK